jgi:hypothetical protein
MDAWFLFKKKLNWGVGLTFQVPSRYGIHKYRFSPIAAGRTPTRL